MVFQVRGPSYAARARLNVLSHYIKGEVSVSWHTIILQCGRDQYSLNAHSVDPHSMRIESWSSVDRPIYILIIIIIYCLLLFIIIIIIIIIIALQQTKRKR